MISLMRLGALLATARRDRCITRVHVAEHLGIHPSHWGRIENGKSAPSVGVLLRACLYLDVDVGSLAAVGTYAAGGAS